MKHLVAFFALLLCAQPAFAVDATVNWTTNQEPDLAGCKVYVGPASGTYTFPGSPFDVPGATCTSYVVTGLQAGTTYFFAATAYDKTGNESDKSKEMSKAIAAAIVQPKILTMTVDVDGATLTLNPNAAKLRYFDDFTTATALTDFAPNATTYRLMKHWAPGTTFVCVEPQGSDGTWNAANRMCKAVVPEPPKDITAPAAPVIQSVTVN